MVDFNAFADLFNSLGPKDQRVLSTILQTLAEPRDEGDTRPPAVGLAQFYEPWRNDLANSGRSPLTIKVYSLPVRALIEQFPAPTVIDLDTWFTLVRGRCSDWRLYTHVGAIRSFLKYCLRRECPVKPLLSALPSAHQPKKRRSPAPVEDVQRVLSYRKLKPRTRALLMILVDSGPRLGEVLQLRRTDLDLRHRQITIMGKGRRQRTIPISLETVEAIQSHLATCRRSTYLFPSTHPGGFIWDSGSVNRHLRHLCEIRGITPFTAHQIRHTFTTESINNGANINAISEILGHSSVTTTLNIYHHTNTAYNRREHRLHTPLNKILKKEKRPRGRPRGS